MLAPTQDNAISLEWPIQILFISINICINTVFILKVSMTILLELAFWDTTLNNVNILGKILIRSSLPLKHRYTIYMLHATIKISGHSLSSLRAVEKSNLNPDYHAKTKLECFSTSMSP